MLGRWQSIKSLVVNISLFWDLNQGRILVVEKGTIPSEQYHCQWSFLRGKKPKGIFLKFGNLLHPLELVPNSRKTCGYCNGIGSTRSLVDFLDLSNSGLQEEAALATNWIKDRPEGVKLQNLALAPMAGPAMSSLPKKYDCGCSVCH